MLEYHPDGLPFGGSERIDRIDHLIGYGLGNLVAGAYHHGHYEQYRNHDTTQYRCPHAYTYHNQEGEGSIYDRRYSVQNIERQTDYIGYACASALVHCYIEYHRDADAGTNHCGWNNNIKRAQYGVQESAVRRSVPLLARELGYHIP